MYRTLRIVTSESQALKTPTVRRFAPVVLWTGEALRQLYSRRAEPFRYGAFGGKSMGRNNAIATLQIFPSGRAAFQMRHRRERLFASLKTCCNYNKTGISRSLVRKLLCILLYSVNLLPSVQRIRILPKLKKGNFDKIGTIGRIKTDAWQKSIP